MIKIMWKKDYQEMIALLVESHNTMSNCAGAIETGQVIDKDVHGVLRRRQKTLRNFLKKKSVDYRSMRTYKYITIV